MSYLSREHSTHAGQPIELYRFVLGTTRWTWTSSDEPVTFNAETYTPITLKRSGIDQSEELNKARLAVEVPRDNPLAALFVAMPPDGTVSLTVYRAHRGDGEFISYWKGRLLSVSWSGATATLACEPVFTSLKRAGLRARYQSACRHVLYDHGCLANNQSFRVDGTLTLVNGNQIAANAWATKPDGWLTGGYVRVGDVPQRLILAHSNDTLTLSAPLPGLVVGTVVEAFAGCDHSLSTCQAKFSNAANYGGFPFVPAKNPFSGDPIV